MSRRARTGLICALLVAATWAVYAQVRHFELVDFDDLSYITDNPHVRTGLSPGNVRWAFTHAYDGYWMPLTWLSYMADRSLFDAQSGAYHLTSVALHAATACVLFLALNRVPDDALPDESDLEAVTLAIAASDMTKAEATEWLSKVLGGPA